MMVQLTEAQKGLKMTENNCQKDIRQFYDTGLIILVIFKAKMLEVVRMCFCFFLINNNK